MWPQGLYLNFVRHTAFLYADLVDKVDFSNKRQGLLTLADLVDERFDFLKTKIESHLNSGEFQIDFNEMINYWGRFYLYSEIPETLPIKVWKDPSKFEKGVAKIRDVFHYESMLKIDINFDKMIVANTGFSKHIKKEKQLKTLPIEIISAPSRQMDFFE